MKKLQVLLLGSPEVAWEGKLFPIPRRNPRALLFYLASKGDLAGRNELLDLFSEEESDDRSRLRLRETLNKLKAALPDPSVILTQADLIGLDLEKTAVDYLNFQDLISGTAQIPWKIPPNEPLPGRIAGDLEKAAGLWRNTRFMAGARLPNNPSFDNWLTQTAQHAEHLLERVLERLCDHHWSLGNLETALHFARLALNNDLLNENIQERVLRLLVHLGRHGEAIHQYKDYQKICQREFGAPPNVTLEAILQVPGEVQPPIRKTDWNRKLTLQVPFVGREDVLKQLHRASELGGASLVLGESGLGKTRLVQEFYWQQQPRPRLLAASCRPNESSLLFQPLIDLLRNSISSGEWVLISPSWASILLPIFPDLNDYLPHVDHPPGIAPGLARGQVLEALRQLFAGLAKKQRLLLFLDDAHWADEATLAALAYLADRPPFDRQSAIIVAARQEENKPQLDLFIHSLSQAGRIRLIQVGRLNSQETAELTQYMLGYPPHASFTEQLTAETGGNPLFLLEILRYFQHTPQKLPAPGDLSGGRARLPLPDSIQILIRNRLKILRPQALKTLEIAAIIGGDFQPAVIVGAGEISQDEIAQSLEELEWHHLIEPAIQAGSNPNPEPTYRFIHDKIREAILIDLNPVRAGQLHGQVALALETTFGDQAFEHSAILASHYELAGKTSEAYHHWIQAGLRARQLFSTTEAFNAFARAEALLKTLADSTSDDSINRLYDPWIEMAYELEDLASLQQLGESLLRLGEQRGSSLLIGTALERLADGCLLENRFEQGLAYANQAIPYLEKADSPFEHMKAYSSRGVFLYMQNRWEESLEAFTDSLAIGTEAISAGGDSPPDILRARADAHYQIALVNSLIAMPLIGREHAARSLADYTTVKRLFGQASAYSVLALSNHFLGNYQRSVQDCQQGIDIATRIQGWRVLGYLHTICALTKLAMGHIGESLAHAQEAITLGEYHQHSDITAIGYHRLGDVFAAMFAVEEALANYQRGLAIDSGGFWGLDGMLRCGYVLCLAGHMQEGQKLMQQALSLTEQSGLTMVNLVGQISQATLLPLSGSWDQAYQAARKLEEDTRRRSLDVWNLATISILGMISLHHLDLEGAYQHFMSVAERASLLPQPWIEIRALAFLSEISQNSNQTPNPHPQRIQILLKQLESSLSSAGGNPLYQAVKEAFKRYQERNQAGFT